ncbi:CENPX protein, partial [Corythaixoides concolor]|nr:CENPX protein [Corythaixoides concolor]
SSALLSAQDTADRLLRLHFRDRRTRVNGDAQLLMAEMLNVFVRGERAPAPAAGPPGRGTALRPPQPPFPSPCTAEAAARAARQAQAEDLEQVDLEHVEKVLPQLVRDC